MCDNNEDSQDTNYNRNDPHLRPSSLRYVVGAGSDPGKRQKRNEDSLFAASCTDNTPSSLVSCGLFVVADGMGAYANGQDASRTAVQAIVDWAWPRIVNNQPLPCLALLGEAMQRANKVVVQQNITLQKLPGTDVDVGVLTTVTAAMMVGSTAYLAHVGNGRCYCSRPGEGLKQITTDHSVIARLVQDGILAPEAIYTHPKRNQISRALFDQPSVECDLFTVPLHPGETILLCSYGLWEMVRDPTIEAILAHTPGTPSQAADRLIQAALDSGGKQNVSVIVISVEEQSQTRLPGLHLFASPDNLHLPTV